MSSAKTGDTLSAMSVEDRKVVSVVIEVKNRSVTVLHVHSPPLHGDTSERHAFTTAMGCELSRSSSSQRVAKLPRPVYTHAEVDSD